MFSGQDKDKEPVQQDTESECKNYYDNCGVYVASGAIVAAFGSEFLTKDFSAIFVTAKGSNDFTLYECFKKRNKLQFCNCPKLYSTYEYTKIIEQIGLEFTALKKTPNSQVVQKQFTSVKDRLCKCESESNSNCGKITSGSRLANTTSNTRITTANTTSNTRITTANTTSNTRITTANISSNTKTGSSQTTTTNDLTQSLVIPSENTTTTINMDTMSTQNNTQNAQTTTMTINLANLDITPTQIQMVETEIETLTSTTDVPDSMTLSSECLNCIAQINEQYLLKDGITYNLITDPTFQDVVKQCAEQACLGLDS